MGREPHVALFVPTLGGGGAERVMLTLANGFAARGVRVDLVLVRATGALLSEVPPSVRVVDLGAGRVITSLPRLVAYLRRERPTTLLSTLNTANVVAVWASRLAATATRSVVRQASHVSWDIGQTPQPSRMVLRSLVRSAYPRADVVVAVSAGVANDLVRTVHVPPERIRTLPSPLLSADIHMKAAAPPEHPWLVDQTVPVVLGAGRLSAEKGFATLIRAFAAARRTRPCRLVILGEGPDRPRLETLAAELGIEADIALPGFLANPFAYMARARVFVLSSATEGLPGVLIHALACGARVIATDCDPGVRELLGNGEFGLTVAVGDVDGMARAILTALDLPRQAPPESVIAQFTDARAVEGYLRVLAIETPGNA